MENQAESVVRRVINSKEFDKKVEIEAAHLEYMHKMGKEKAYKKAQEIISRRFAVE